MFEELNDRQEERSSEEQDPDYTGLKIVGILIPVFFVFIYFGKAELGFTTVTVLGMMLLAIKLQWKLRKHIWFWVTIGLVLILHIPLVLLMRWPETKTPTIAYSLPLGIADFLVISGAIRLSQSLFLRSTRSDEEDE